MQINLTGFLTKDTPAFMTALWNLLLEAQTDVAGVPRTFIEEKKEEMRKARANDTRTFDERDRRARLDEIRDGDRGGRGGGRGRGIGRGRGRGRGGFDDDRGGRGRDSGWGNRGGRGGGGGGGGGVSSSYLSSCLLVDSWSIMCRVAVDSTLVRLRHAGHGPVAPLSAEALLHLHEDSALRHPDVVPRRGISKAPVHRHLAAVPLLDAPFLAHCLALLLPVVDLARPHSHPHHAIGVDTKGETAVVPLRDGVGSLPLAPGPLRVLPVVRDPPLPVEDTSGAALLILPVAEVPAHRRDAGGALHGPVLPPAHPHVVGASVETAARNLMGEKVPDATARAQIVTHDLDLLLRNAKTKWMLIGKITATAGS